MLRKPIIAILIALVSFCFSALTYYRNSISAQLQREQLAQMRIVAARCAVLWDQINLIVSAQVKNLEVDSYLFQSIQKNASRLEESLDEAIGYGLMTTLLENRENSMVMYSTFIQGLQWIATMPNPENQPLEEWTKQHFLFGMIRLLDVCFRYKKNVLPNFVEQKIAKQINPLIDNAWQYLSVKAVESQT